MFPAFFPARSRNLAASSGTARSYFSHSPKPPFRKSRSSPAKPTAARIASWPPNTSAPTPISPGPPRKSPSWAPRERSTSFTNASSTKLPNPSAKNCARKKLPNSAIDSPILSSPPNAATSTPSSSPPTPAPASSPLSAPSKTNATPTPARNTATSHYEEETYARDREAWELVRCLGGRNSWGEYTEPHQEISSPPFKGSAGTYYRVQSRITGQEQRR